MLSSQTFLPRRARAIAAATLLSLAGTTFARDAAAPSPGGWVISRSEGGDGCFMSKSFDHPGATTLLFGLDGDGTNHLTVLNSHWSIKPRDRLKLDFRLTGGAYPGHFAIGLAADGKRGFVTSFEPRFPAYIAASRTLEIARGKVPVEKLPLDGSGAAVASLRKCVAALGRRGKGSDQDGTRRPRIPLDPFAAPASRGDGKDG